MSQHHHLLEMYKPGINTEMAYPVDAGNPNDTSDRWAFKPGFSSDPTPVDKALWADRERMWPSTKWPLLLNTRTRSRNHSNSLL